MASRKAARGSKQTLCNRESLFRMKLEPQTSGSNPPGEQAVLGAASGAGTLPARFQVASVSVLSRTAFWRKHRGVRSLQPAGPFPGGSARKAVRRRGRWALLPISAQRLQVPGAREFLTLRIAPVSSQVPSCPSSRERRSCSSAAASTSRTASPAHLSPVALYHKK